MEILAPCGNYEKFKAAFLADADAFYLGLERYSARTNAGNFTVDELKQVALFSKFTNKKLFITINTLLSDSQISDIYSLLSNIYNIEITGIIIQDLALIDMVKKSFPKFNLISSTQMSIHNIGGVRFLENEGFYQTVLARELSIDEIKKISEESKIFTEVFIHGALCVSYSGQCLFSGMIGSRSGNHGSCAQVCRKKFRDGGKSLFLLSPKDLDGSNYVERLRKSRVKTLKIEGRMRSPEYVYSTTKYYKSLAKGVVDNDLYFASKISFDRGSESGYFEGKNLNLINRENSSNKGLYIGVVKSVKNDVVPVSKSTQYTPKKGDGLTIERKGKRYGFELKSNAKSDNRSFYFSENINQFKIGDKVYINSSGEIKKELQNDIFIYLDLNILSKDRSVLFLFDNHSISMEYEIAKKGGFSSLLRKKLNNFTHKSFKLSINRFDIDDNIFLPISKIKQALSNYIDSIISSAQNLSRLPLPMEIVDIEDSKPSKPNFIFTVDNFEALNLVKDSHKIYIDFQFYINNRSKLDSYNNLYIILPNMIKDKYYNLLEKIDKKHGVVVSNLGEIIYFKERGFNIDTWYSLNIKNRYSRAKLEEYIDGDIIHSLETDLNDISFDKKSSLYIFGYPHVMTTEASIQGEGGSESNKTVFTDQEGSNYRVFENNLSQNIILFSKPVYLPIEKIKNYSISNYIVDLRYLSNKGMKTIVFHYLKGEKLDSITPFKGGYKF